MESHQNIQCLDLDYLSRSASLHVPWDTRICSLPRAAPGTGRTDGTCWARMGHGRQHRWDLDTHTNTFKSTFTKTTHVSTTFSFSPSGGRGDIKNGRGAGYEDFLCNRGHFLIGFGNITRPD